MNYLIWFRAMLVRISANRSMLSVLMIFVCEWFVDCHNLTQKQGAMSNSNKLLNPHF